MSKNHFEEIVPLNETSVRFAKEFKNMETLRKTAQPLLEIAAKESPEALRAAKMVFGLLENEAVLFEDIPGIGVIDKSISGLIRALNNTGFFTLASCSGVASDHKPEYPPESGYISFIDNEKNRELLMKLKNLEKYNPYRAHTYFKPSICIHFKEEQREALEIELMSYCNQL